MPTPTKYSPTPAGALAAKLAAHPNARRRSRYAAPVPPKPIKPRNRLNDLFAACVPLEPFRIPDGCTSADFARCDADGVPDWSGVEAGGERKNAGGGGGKCPSQSAKMVALAEGAGAELFTDADGEAYITFAPAARGDAAGPPETRRLRSRAVGDWLCGLLYAAEGTAPGSEAVSSAKNVLAAKARADGRQRPVAVRVAEVPGGFVLDLGGPEWEGVHVTADGWRVVPLRSLPAGCDVRFVRPRGLRPLPKPVPGGDLADLRPFVNVADDAAFALVLAWLSAAVRPTGPFPVLIVNGEQGSAKTTVCRVLRRLVDPNKADLRAAPRDERDLMIAAKNGHVVGFDNFSTVKPDLADTLCRLSTGGGFATRQLHSDGEEVIFAASRPVLVNGIPTLSDRPDLLDRAVAVVLPRIEPAARRTEEQFWAAFEEARPRLLGALLDAAAVGLRNLPGVALAEPPRMADFAAWAVACEPAFPVDPETFLEAYAESRADAHEVALEGEALTAPVRKLASRGPWEGTATELLAQIKKLAAGDVTRGRDWPSKPHVMSGRLRRIAPDLRAAGVSIEFLDKTRPKAIRVAEGGNRRPRPE